MEISPNKNWNHSIIPGRWGQARTLEGKYFPGGGGIDILDGVVVRVVIRSVEQYDIEKIKKQTESEVGENCIVGVTSRSERIKQ